jgi:hypothetical protein
MDCGVLSLRVFGPLLALLVREHLRLAIEMIIFLFDKLKYLAYTNIHGCMQDIAGIHVDERL